MKTKELFETLKSDRTPFVKTQKYKRMYGRKGTESVSVYFVPDQSIHKPNIDTISLHQHELKEKRYYFLNSLFDNQWSQKKDFFNPFQYSFIHSLIVNLHHKLFSIGVDNIELNLTEDQSIFVQGSKSGQNIYIEIFLDEEMEQKYDAVLNFYDRNGQAFGFSGSIDQIIEKIEDESRSNVPQIVWSSPTTLPYEVSEETYSPFAL